jgi:hypothetical protein
MMRIALGAVAALSATATMWAGGTFDSSASSKADFVSASCRAPANAPACAVALRYLAALDLDRARDACALLDRPTLEAAGGMTGCTKMLSQARGVRIHYSIAAVLPSPLGRTIRFSTRAGDDAPLRQQMLVSPAARIVAVVPEP